MSNQRRKSTARLKRKLFGGRRKAPCKYCGKTLTPETATFDHVRPLSQGGYHKAKNGALACYSCNQAKGSKSIGEFLWLKREGGK
jgi:5-methylcytosine-specific restriction endonuclease McrA